MPDWRWRKEFATASPFADGHQGYGATGKGKETQNNRFLFFPGLE